MEIHELVEEYKEKVAITAPDIVFQEMRDIKSWDREAFFCLYLDSRAIVISREIVSIGTLNSCIIHPREVFKTAIIRNENSIILSHNHPSGALKPSQEDISITQQIKKAGKIIGINLLDHVIVTSDGYYSLHTNGDM